MLVIFTQCEDSLTVTANQDQNEELTEVSLTAPEDGSEQPNAIEFVWNELESANSYEFQLSGDSQFSSTLIDSVTDETSFEIKGLPYDSTLYWQVRPIIDGQEGPWSNTWQVFTEPKPENSEPVTTDLKSPQDGSSKSPSLVKLSWTTIASASAYKVQLASNQEFNSFVIDEEITSSSYEVTDLSEEETYYWRVKPNIPDEETQWSEVYDFTTLAEDEIGVPVQLSPDDGATDVGLQPTFKWESVEGADYYILHANRLDPGEMVIETEVEGTTFTPENNLDTETTHDWRIRAVSGNTQGEWSEIHRFTTGSGDNNNDPEDTTVSLLSPSDGAGSQSTSPSLNWESVSGINEYQVQLATGNSFSSPVVDEAVAQTSYEVSNLDYSQTYYWRVQANGDGDSQNWSSVRSFTTKSESTSPSQGGRTEDEEALEALYMATGGSDWDNSRGWSSSGMSLEDDIYGVEVESIDGELRVVSIKLNGSTGWIRRHLEGNDGRRGGNNLTGQLPSEIGNLTACKYFNVKNNYLKGTIPKDIGNMESLQALYLNGRYYDFAPQDAHHPGKDHDTDERSNSFTGQFPSEVGNLTELIYLEAAGEPNWTKDNVGEQGFTGSVPASINNLTNLQGLHLTWSSFTSIPDLGNLTDMIDISFNANDATLPFPSWVGKMINLRYVWFSDIGGGDDGTGFTGAIPDLSALTKLEVFDVGKNSLTGEFPNYMIDGTMPNINMLTLGWNDNLGGSFGQFGKTNLTMLSVNGCSMSGEIPESITRAKRMVNLNLGYGNSFEGQFPDLSGMSQLRHVYANDNNFTGTVPMVDTSNEDLQFLYFQNNQLSEQIPADLADIGKLPKVGSNDLNVSGNPFSDSELQPIINALKKDGNLNILNY